MYIHPIKFGITAIATAFMIFLALWDVWHNHQWDDAAYWILFYIYIFWFLEIRLVYWFTRKPNMAEYHEGNAGTVIVWWTRIIVVASNVFVIISDDYDCDHWNMCLTMPRAVQWIGIGIGYFTVLAFWWIHHVLGDNWSATVQIKVGHSLTTGGPYRFARHPMYTVYFLYCVAVFMNTGDYLITACLFIHWAYAASRIGKEEKLMYRMFGQDYHQFKLHIGAFLPCKMIDCGYEPSDTDYQYLTDSTATTNDGRTTSVSLQKAVNH